MQEFQALSQTNPLPQSVRRGIAPGLLLSQVDNTAPFLFFDGFGEDSRQPHVSLLRQLRRGETTVQDHVGYFRLCLSAHHATVASFVPTDVDVAIRFKLWDPTLSTQILVEMARVVLESQSWSGRGLSARLVDSLDGGTALSGLMGEWYSTAVAAYGALRKRAPEMATEILEWLRAEVEREERIFLRYEERNDGLAVLKVSTILAHNLGDLDRVVDQWNLPEADPLRQSLYKRGHSGNSPSVRAGALNKAFMAAENHRHLALRGPRCLRQRSEWLLPFGPFFDDWGGTIARGLEEREVGEVVDALVSGWERLPETVGYARALAGILESFPGGGSRLRRAVPARTHRALESGRLRALISVPRSRFEAGLARAR